MPWNSLTRSAKPRTQDSRFRAHNDCSLIRAFGVDVQQQVAVPRAVLDLSQCDALEPPVLQRAPRHHRELGAEGSHLLSSEIVG